MENPTILMVWKPGLMGIFMGYVSLPEGNWIFIFKKKNSRQPTKISWRLDLESGVPIKITMFLLISGPPHVWGRAQQ